MHSERSAAWTLLWRLFCWAILKSWVPVTQREASAARDEQA